MSDWITGFKYGLLIAIFIVLCWWAWARYVYRFNDDRISNAILRQEALKDISRYGIDGRYSLYIISYEFNKSNMTANVTLGVLEKSTTRIAQRFNVIYRIVLEDKNCGILNENCIVI